MKGHLSAARPPRRAAPHVFGGLFTPDVWIPQPCALQMLLHLLYGHRHDHGLPKKHRFPEKALSGIPTDWSHKRTSAAVPGNVEMDGMVAIQELPRSGAAPKSKSAQKNFYTPCLGFAE